MEGRRFGLIRSITIKNNDVKTENNKSNAVFSIPDTDSEGRKLTPEHREFFKNSKVVDSKGRLLKMYHGTDAEFTVFDKEMIGSKMEGLKGQGLISLRTKAEQADMVGRSWKGISTLKNRFPQRKRR